MKGETGLSIRGSLILAGQSTEHLNPHFLRFLLSSRLTKLAAFSCAAGGSLLSGSSKGVHRGSYSSHSHTSEVMVVG